MLLVCFLTLEHKVLESKSITISLKAVPRKESGTHIRRAAQRDKEIRIARSPALICQVWSLCFYIPGTQECVSVAGFRLFLHLLQQEF